MVEDEQTDKTKKVGDAPDSKPEDDKPLSLYDKTEAMVTRQEAANKKEEELLERREKLFANERLAGTAGGHVEAPKVSPEAKKAKDAAVYFEGTQLAEDIKKANE